MNVEASRTLVANLREAVRIEQIYVSSGARGPEMDIQFAVHGAKMRGQDSAPGLSTATCMSLHDKAQQDQSELHELRIALLHLPTMFGLQTCFSGITRPSGG